MAQDSGVANLPPKTPPAGKALPALVLDPGKLPLFRIAQTKLGPVYFSPSNSNRFREPSIPGGELYLGETPSGCFWEVFWDSLKARGSSELHVQHSQLASRSLYRVQCNRPMRVFPAYGAALKKIDATVVGCFNGDYACCRQWAAYVYHWDTKLDGILYPAARGTGLNLVLFGSRVQKSDMNSTSIPGIEILKVPAICDLLQEEGIYTY